MDPKARDALVARLVEIAQAATVDQPISISIFPAKVIQNAVASFVLAGSAYFDFLKACQQVLRRDDWARKFSEGCVESSVTMVLSRIVADGSREKASLYVDELLEHLGTFATEFTVLVPVENVFMSLESIALGQVTLRRITAAYIEQQLSLIAVDTVADSTDKDGQSRIEGQRETLEAHLAGKVCMECQMVAELQRAMERALELCRKTIGLLRYALPAIYPEVFLGASAVISDDRFDANGRLRSMTDGQQRARDERRRKVGIGLSGEVLHGAREVACLSAAGESYHFAQHATGPREGMLINGLTRFTLESLGVFELADLLARENLSDFERRLLSGAHWFANALVQIERENELTSLVTVLETFLAPGESDRIVNKIADGVAFVLTEDGGHRVKIRDRVRELYALRSKVSHGTPIPFTGDDLDELTSLAMSLLHRMIGLRGKFASAKELNTWIETRKLSGSWGEGF